MLLICIFEGNIFDAGRITATPRHHKNTIVRRLLSFTEFFFQRLGCTSLRFLVGCRTRPSCTEFYWVSSIRVSPRNLLPFLSIFSIVSNELNLIDSCRTIDLMSNMKSQQQQHKEGKETLSISNFGQGQFN